MKKFLSLVLALVMTMSLVTISAGAKDFTDEGDTTYVEAVDVMSEIGIIDGYADGKFQPTVALTRGAAAKIICNMILGPTTAGALNADAAPFADVPTTNVFAGYIAYCAQQGIINGYGDGTFRPTATLNGYAFMKMLLGALGYDGTKEGYTGGNWSIAVAKQALALGLDDNLVEDFVGSKAVTREEAMLYGFNTLTADMVKYENDSTITVGDIVISNNSKAEPVTNTEEKDYRTQAASQDKIMQFCEQYFAKLKLDNDAEEVTDDFARPANIWIYKNDEVGTYAKDADKIFTVSQESGDLYSALNLSSTKTYEVYVDGEYDGTLKIERGNEDLDIGGNGVILEVYKDEMRICVINVWAAEVENVEEATSKKDAYITLTALTGPATDEEFETEAFEEEDIVLYTYSAKVDEVKSVVAAKSVTGEVTKYTDTKNFVLDGTTYKYSENKEDTITNVDTDYTIYLDEYGYVIYFDEGDVSSTNFAFVLAAGADSTRGGTDKWAKLLYSDGTIETVTTSKIYGTGNGATADYNYVGKFVNYKTNSSNKVVLTEAGSYTNSGLKDTNDNAYIVENGKATIDFKSGADGKANSATTFLLYSAKDDEAKVYAGIKKVPDVKTPASSNATQVATLTKNSGSYANLVVIYTDGATKSNSTNNFLFIQGKSVKETVTSDDSYYEFDAVLDGKITTVKLDSDESAAVIAKLTTKIATDEYVNFLAADYSVDGEIYTVTMANAASGDDGKQDVSAVTKASGDVIGLDSSFLLADGVVVFRISSSGTLSTSSVSALRTGTVGTASTDYYAQVSYSLNSDGEVTGIYFELN